MLALIFLSISFIMLWALPNLRTRLFFVAAVLIVLGACRLVSDISNYMDADDFDRHSVVTQAHITSLAMTNAFEVSYENTAHQTTKATVFVPGSVYDLARKQSNLRGVKIRYLPSNPKRMMLEGQHPPRLAPAFLTPLILTAALFIVPGLVIGFFTWRSMKS